MFQKCSKSRCTKETRQHRDHTSSVQSPPFGQIGRKLIVHILTAIEIITPECPFFGRHSLIRQKSHLAVHPLLSRCDTLAGNPLLLALNEQFPRLHRLTPSFCCPNSSRPAKKSAAEAPDPSGFSTSGRIAGRALPKGVSDAQCIELTGQLLGRSRR